MAITMLSTILLFGTFLVFLFTGIPISIGIGMSSLLAGLTVIPIKTMASTAAQRTFAGLDSFSLLAVPFFMLAGAIMNKGGIAIRLINFAKLIGGRLPGSLAHTNVLGNMFFGSISGSSIAAAAAIGGTIAPLQEAEGYDKAYSASINIASAPSGILIPPSGPLVLFSLTSGGTSIAALFLAGYIPGILMGLTVMIIAYIFAKKYGYTVEKKYTMTEGMKVTLEALPALLMAVVVMGGILGGVFTPTEAAAVAVLYSFVLSVFIFKTIKISEIPEMLSDTLLSASSILFLVGISGTMSWIMAYTGIPKAISSGIMSISSNPYIIIFIMNVILLLVGTFMDITPAILIFTPIFLPIATKLGMDPVHFGIMMIFNMGIGNITPPVGSVLFVGCQIGGVSIEEVTKYILCIFIALLGTLMLITYIPALSLFLPRLAGLL